MTRFLTIVLILLAGCTTSPGNSEANREVVLKYLDADVGTAGPFSKQGKRELDVLSEKDRATALGLLERGAVGFVVFAPAHSAEAGSVARIVLVLSGKVIGDFPAFAKAPNKALEPTPTVRGFDDA